MSLNAQAKDASKMPVFDGDEKNWTSWKRLFRSYLRRNSRKEFDLLDAVTKIRNGDEAKTLKLKNKNEDASTDDEEELLVQLYDSLVLACRGQAAAVITTLPVEDDEDGAKAWLALLYKYEVHTRARFVSIHHQMLNARLDMANPDEYFHKVDLLRKQLSEVSVDRRLMSDEEMISFALYALPSEVVYLRSILEADSNLTYATLKNHVRSHAEGSRQTNQEASANQALISRAPNARFRGTCHKCGRRGHKANQCRSSTNQGRPNQVPVPTCSNCGRAGHDTKMCYAPGGDKHHANVTQATQQHFAFSAEHSSDVDPSYWIVDSACTAHMTGESADLTNPKTIAPIQVECGGGVILQATQVGSVSIKTKDSSGNVITVHLQGVLFVPKLGKRLFSVKKFIRSGASKRVEFRNKQQVVSTDEVDVPLQEHANLFVFSQISREKGLATMAQLWHRRLGHVNSATVKRVLDANPALRRKKLPDHICEDCAETKSVRASFPKSAQRRTTAKLQLVHTDLWGPITPTSIGGAAYAVIFVDDYTRLKKLYFMKRKSELPAKLEDFVADVAVPEDLKIKRLRSDCGGEYKSAKMKSLCRKLGIKQEFSAPYSQAQNGVAERSWRTLGRMAKAMLKDAGLPKKFWAEAMNTACYTGNRLPTNALNGDSPYHRWTNQIPKYSRLRVFGCPVFVHVHADRKKLDDNAMKCIFLGYDYQSTAYRIWNPASCRVIYSVHVRFQEQASSHEDDTSSDAAQADDCSGYVDMPVPAGAGSQQGSDEADESFAGEADGPESDADSKLSDDADSDSKQSLDDADDDMYLGGDDAYEMESSLAELPSPEDSERPYNLRPRHTAMVATNDEPTYREALVGPEVMQWRQAMQEEYKTLVDNGTWSIVERPKDKNVIGSKWVLRIKRNADGTVNKFKARLVAQGFSQVWGQDYFETFSPVTQCTSIRCLVALAAQHGWKLHQMDVCAAFLNAEVKEEIYMKPPPGMEEELGGKVLRLSRVLLVTLEL